MTYTIYGRPNCKFCNLATKLLNEKDIHFEYKDISVNNIREELLSLLEDHPGQTKVPQIWNESGYVGGYEELLRIFVSEKPITENM